MILISEFQAQVFIIGAALVAILFGIINALLILRVKVYTVADDEMAYKEDELYQ